jgi:hypothetical protein
MFVLDLFRHKVIAEYREMAMAGDDGPPLGVAQARAPEAVSEMARVAGEHADEEDDDQIFLNSLMQAGATVEVPTKGISLETMLEGYKTKILQELNSYQEFCKKIHWTELLQKFGTDKYKKLLKEKKLLEQKLNVNPRYTRSLFDVISWWRDMGSKLFPHLAVAAFIVLAKATHNGYQERVFSIGTFMDTKQQKRREQRHYEMDILTRINSEVMQEDEYWKECMEDQDDKATLESFFKITEEVVEKIASEPTAKAVPPSNDSDEVTVGSSDDGEEDGMVPYVDIAGSDDEDEADSSE